MQAPMTTLPQIGAYLRPTADATFTQFALQVVHIHPGEGDTFAIGAHSMPLGTGRQPQTERMHPGLCGVRLKALPNGAWLQLDTPDYLHRAWELTPTAIAAPAQSQARAVHQCDLFAEA